MLDDSDDAWGSEDDDEDRAAEFANPGWQGARDRVSILMYKSCKRMDYSFLMGNVRGSLHLNICTLFLEADWSQATYPAPRTAMSPMITQGRSQQLSESPLTR